MEDRKRKKSLERIDLGIGFAGFFVIAFFVMTLITELTGGNAVGTAIPTLLAAVVIYSLWRLRRRVQSRDDGVPTT
jgi:membrane protein implicated in regulation of membrane protease activity